MHSKLDLQWDLRESRCVLFYAGDEQGFMPNRKLLSLPQKLRITGTKWTNQNFNNGLVTNNLENNSIVAMDNTP